MRSKYTKEILLKAVQTSISFAGVLRELGLRVAGGNQSYIKKLVSHFEIDTSHFLGQTANRGKQHRGGPEKKEAHDVLVLGEIGYHQPGWRLKRSLLEIGRKEICELCGTGTTWNGNCLNLQVDHKNGNRWDNRPSNLRMLCPNCHSQTPNFGSKNKSGNEESMRKDA